MSEKIEKGALQIRDVEFDLRARSIVVEDRKTLLDTRSCSVFLALADHFGECVGKDALLLAGWPSQLVHENSLAKAISKLRRAISGSQLEIAAFYGQGYGLREAGDRRVEVDNSTLAESRPEATEQSWSRRGLGVTIALLLVLLTGGGALLALELPRPAVAIRDSLPITHDAPDALATILWVDDHPVNNRLEVEDLKHHRIAVHLATSTDDALKLLAMNDYSLVISDLGRGEDRLAGLKMTTAMKQRGIPVPVIIYTVRPKDRSGQEAQRKLVADAGATDLAVTPEEVRAKVLERLSLPA